MTLHKIDREKLAKLLDGLKNFDDINIIEQAAQNWLTITDEEFLHYSNALKDLATFKALFAKAGE